MLAAELVGLLERIDAARREKRSGVDDYITDYMAPASFSYNGSSYSVPLSAYGVTQTMAGQQVQRPDWCGLVFGSEQEPDDAATALDGELIGLVYQNGGLFSSSYEPRFLLPDQFAHWSQIPDPEVPGMGQSWVSAALADVRADRSATLHKYAYFANGATPNLVIKGIPATSREQFEQIVDVMEAKHAGVANAYKTLYLTAGADATGVGSDLKELDFKATQGAGETPVAFLARGSPRRCWGSPRACRAAR